MPGNANGGRGSSPLSANQCHFDGLLPSGSQNADAGTRQRRCSKLSFQSFVVALSSRVLVTRLGAYPGRNSTKPQLRSTSSRSPSALCLMIGAMWPGKIADKGSNAVMRLSESWNFRARSMRLVLIEYRLHMLAERTHIPARLRPRREAMEAGEPLTMQLQIGVLVNLRSQVGQLRLGRRLINILPASSGRAIGPIRSHVLSACPCGRTVSPPPKCARWLCGPGTQECLGDYGTSPIMG